jgi:hypothetical protein
MPPARQAPTRAGVDLETLMKMQEPLTVHVMRLRGALKEPIPLLTREGQSVGGVGWTKEDVRTIEREVVDVSGGGVYEVQVIDSTQGTSPLSTRFTFILEPSLYAIKAPTTVPVMPGYGGGVGLGNPYGAQPPSAVPWQQRAQQAQPFNGGFGNRTPINNNMDAAGVAQMTQYQNEVHRRDLALLEERHRHERELATLQQQQAQTQAAAQAAATRRDPLVDQQLAEARRAAEETKQQMAQMQAEQRAKEERDAAERRAEDRERARDAQATADRKAADDRFAAIIAQMNTQNTQNQQMMQQFMARPSGPDPMITLLIEQQRATADASKETARLKSEEARALATATVEAARIQSESQQRLITTVQAMMAPNQMSPMDAARIVKEAATGSDQLVTNAMRTANDMLEMNRTFTANMLAMAPQGEGTAGRVIGAIEDVAKTWSQNQAQAQAAQAAAMREQYKTQQMAMGGWQPPPQVAPTGAAAPSAEAGAAPSGPLNGAQAAPVAAPAPQEAQPSAVDAAMAPGSVVRNGKTDAEWFGPALGDVLRLREGATKYLVAVAAAEATLDQPSGEPITVVHDSGEHAGKPIGLSPLGAARYLVMAAAQIEAKNVPVEAFNYFYKQQMYHALVGVLIPDAPQPYRDDVLRFFNRLLVGEQPYQENDAPMFGIERFLEEDDADDAPPARPATNGARGRAPVGAR